MTNNLYIGIDAGSEEHEVIILGLEKEFIKQIRISNDSKGYKEIITELRELCNQYNCSAKIGIEGSFGNSTPLDFLLQGEGYQALKELSNELSVGDMLNRKRLFVVYFSFLHPPQQPAQGLNLAYFSTSLVSQPP